VINETEAYARVCLDDDDVPLFVIEFDEKGECRSPHQRDALVTAVADGTYQDVHIYSHGWNNAFDVAVARYNSFFKRYLDVRRQLGNHQTGYPGRPVTELGRSAFVGIVWPSTALVTPSERSPVIGGTVAIDDATLEEARHVADAIGADKDQLIRSLELPVIGGADGEHLLTLFLPLFATPDEASVVNASSVLQLSALLQRRGEDADDDDVQEPLRNVYSDSAVGPGIDPVAGGSLPFPVDPRWLVRVASVYVMKDRARVVGVRGVGPGLIEPLMASESAGVHLIGHSFGCAVMLSAVCSAQLKRRLSSALLLEPAVSWLCLAPDVGDRRPGGYCTAPERIAQPLLTTYSSMDRELAHYYPLAMRRGKDVGEPAAGSFGNEPFRALGAFGPAPSTAWPILRTDLLNPGSAYPAAARAARIIALNGSPDKIASHGDVDNRFTAWAHAWAVDVGFCDG
jgi:hypothetical protein